MNRSLGVLGVFVAAVGCGASPGTTVSRDDGGGEGGAAVGDGAPPDVDAAPPTPAASKVDVLFDIDNSASMGDKQRYLAEAIPEFIRRLLNPLCIDSGGQVVGQSVSGQCSQGVPEFAPVTDMHLGIITSSLGPRLSDAAGPGTGVCAEMNAPAPFDNVPNHADDQGHLVARSLSVSSSGDSAKEAPVTDAAQGFIAWYPGAPFAAVAEAGAGELEAGVVADGATTDAMDETAGEADSGVSVFPTREQAAASDLQLMASGVGIWGCGIESQLESWYRFLVQPDPYASLAVDANGRAQWQGVDATILRQRHDFLRPDSLVAVVVLSDENDSEIDVRSLGGKGYLFMEPQYTPPRGTSACATNPGDPACGPCQPGSTDPACSTGPYANVDDWGFDPNLRHVHMKAKYGVDTQFPVSRYVTGLSAPTVPNRDGEYPSGASGYVGTANCTNPLFAASLPDGSSTDASALCQLPAGTRPKDFVLFAHIGGVPSKLLHYVPDDQRASALTDADWVRILGRDPENYDYAGIDPHMIEDYRDRTTVQYPFTTDSSMTSSLVPATSTVNSDQASGREWTTDEPSWNMVLPGMWGGHVLPVDVQYACVFPLAEERDCARPENANRCDCPGADGALTPAQTPPVCEPEHPSIQIGAKAYPTVRELLVAKLLGTQSVVSSICPIHVSEETPGDPLYGYRPGVSQLVGRMAWNLAK